MRSSIGRGGRRRPALAKGPHHGVVVYLIKGCANTESDNRAGESEIIEFGVECSDEVALVTMAGELDVSNSEWLHQWLHQVIDAGYARVVVDIERLTFMDSTGLSTIVDAHKRLRATGGALTVVAPAPIVMRLFHLCDDVPHLMIKDAPDVATNSRGLPWIPNGAA